MSDAAFASARKDLSLFISLRFECRLDFAERQTIHHVHFRQPTFARNSDAEPQVLQALCAMRVRIDHAFDVFLFR